MSDHFATVAWWVAGIVAVLLLLLVMQILALRAVHAVRRTRTAQFREIWEPALAACVVEVPDEWPQLDRRRIRDFLLIWNHMQESMRDDARERLNLAARRVGAGYEAHLMITNGNVSDKLIALTTLGHMKAGHHWRLMTDMLMGDDPVVSLCAARALLRIDPLSAAHIVIEQLAVRPDWPTATVAGILEEAGPDAISEPLARTISRADPTIAPRLIRLLDLAHSEVAAPLVRRLLTETTSTEVLTACLRIANDPNLLDRIRELTRDARWPVRLQAAQALGRIGTDQDEPRLIRALSDREWWVRYRAAQALVALPLVTMDRLHQIRDTVDDRFGRDIMSQVIAEQELAC